MKKRILSYGDYVAGWLDTTIHDVLEVLSATGAGSKYALITCLDSNQDPASLRTKSPELKSLARKVQVVGSGVLLPTELLLANESRRRIFFGFDEVWFFPDQSTTPKPSGVSIVGPARLNRARLSKIGKWMTENSCALGLGGGEGLNFVVRAHGLARFLLGHSIEQPEPALAS